MSQVKRFASRFEIITRESYTKLKNKINTKLYLIEEDGYIVAMFFGNLAVKYVSLKDKDANNFVETGPKVFTLDDSTLDGVDYLG